MSEIIKACGWLKHTWTEWEPLSGYANGRVFLTRTCLTCKKTQVKGLKG